MNFFEKLPLKYLAHLFKRAAELGAWEVLFSVAPEESVYSFVNVFPETFWNSIYLIYVPKFWSKDLVCGYFCPLKESCILFQICIFFKIDSILVRQLKFLRKIVMLSAKFTILVSWSPICMPLILVWKL